MKLVSSLPAVIYATMGTSTLPADAFSLNRLSTSVSSSYKLHVKDSSCAVTQREDGVFRNLFNPFQPTVDDNVHHDDTVSDSSRRSALLRFTAMASTGFILPDKNGVNSVAVADDDSKIFKEDAVFNQYYLSDEQDSNEVLWTPAVNNMDTTSSPDETDSIDPWDKFTPRITPIDDTAVSRAFAANQSPPVTYIKNIEQVEVANAVSATVVSSSPKNDVDLSTDHTDSGSLFALTFPLMVLGGAAVTFAKRNEYNSDPSYTGTGSPKVKVVMVENEPYGLDKGRRYYKGVDVTVYDPIPDSDIRRYCDASVPMVTNECAQSIAGFLEDISLGSTEGANSERTASAIISYLDSLSSGGSREVENRPAIPQATGVAFSSYLQGLSEGSIPAPSSAESVALYLDSLASKERLRVSQLEARIVELESSMDEKVANELDKIVTYLVESTGIELNENLRGSGVGGWSVRNNMDGSAISTNNPNGKILSDSNGRWPLNDTAGRSPINGFDANGSGKLSANGSGRVLDEGGQKTSSLPL